MKYYFYILQCNNKHQYYGHTQNIAQRLKEHRKGKVRPTKSRKPIKLVYFEEFSSRSEAFRREMQCKNGKTRKKTIDKLILGFPKEKCQGFNSQTASSTAYVRSRRSLHKSSAH